MKRFFHGRFFTVLVLIVCFLFGFMLSVAVNGHTAPHQQTVGAILSPLQTGFVWCKNQVSDFFAAFSNYDKVSAENEALREQILALEKQVDELEYVKDYKLQIYEELLAVTELGYEFEFASADVVSVSSDGWEGSLGINAGSAVGIEPGDVVVSGGALVGKVVEVGLNWATVSTFVDPGVSVGAMILSTGDVGVTEGTIDLLSDGKCMLRYLNKDSDVNRGDRVYTSGLGGVYPKGLLLGTISDLRYEDNGLSLDAVLIPSVDFRSLREIFVITDFSEDAP